MNNLPAIGRLTLRLLRCRLSSERSEFVLGDLEEEFRRRAESSVRRAELWLLKQAVILAAAPLPVASVPARKIRLRGTGVSFDGFARDVSYACRSLFRAPAFTTAAVITLAIGIGANTVMFSIVDRLLIRPLPFGDADRLVWVHGTAAAGSLARVSPPDFRDVRRDNQTLSHLAAMFPFPFNVLSGGPAERVNGAMVTADFFETLGVAPAIGRLFEARDAAEVGQWDTGIISYGFWQQRFGGRPEAIGESLLVDGRRVTIVGVMPPEFSVPQTADLWLPCTFDGASMGERKARFVILLGRLRQGSTLTAAQEDVDRIAMDLDQRFPTSNATWRLRLVPLRDQLVGDTRFGLLLLAGSVGLVLLVSCVNVASLLLARSARRRSEMAIRLALGASRFRIIRQLLTEALLLSIVGGGLAILGAFWTTRAVAPWIADAMPPLPFTGLDTRVLLFTLMLSAAAVVLFGVLPAVQASRGHVHRGLIDAGRGPGVGAGRLHARRTLVVVELALTTVLLIGAGLLLRSLAALQMVEPGFEVRHLLTFQIAMPNALEAHQTVAFFDRLVPRIRALPGVASASLASEVPLSDQHNTNTFTVEGQSLADPATRSAANLRRVSDGYFATMNIPLRRGRAFTQMEARRSDRVVAINQAMAERYFPGVDPIGRRLLIDTRAQIEPFEIIGITGDVRHETLTQPPAPEMYIPSLVHWTANVVVRSTDDSHGLVSGIRREIAALDPTIPVSDVTTFDGLLASSIAIDRFRAIVLSSFAGVALLLAAVGLYGVIAYSVALRTREIGVRLALGATRRQVFGEEVGSALKLALLGVAIGAAVATVVVRFATGLVYGVPQHDAISFTIAAALLMGTALTASLIPARRAIRTNPIDALRAE